jgi:predicted DNA-binding transcriptional regulator AlpA
MANKRTPASLPDSLANFDSLPDSAVVRDRVVAGLFGCSKPTVWRMSKDGRIDPPIKVSLRVTGWSVGGLRKKMAAFR